MRKRRRQHDNTMDAVSTLDAVECELAERHLWNFVRLAWKALNPNEAFEDNWHVGCICEHLEALTSLEITKLIINLPPRSLKSWVCSVFWPAWVWIRDPSSDWVFVSYDDFLAERDAIRCRELIQSQWYRVCYDIDWQLTEDLNTKQAYKNTRSGIRLCTTPESAGTGLDADYAVADDPQSVKDNRRANRLQIANDFWDQQLSTRGNKAGRYRRLITQQRIAENDLSGWAMRKEMGYEALILPLHHEPKRHYASRPAAALAGEPDPIVPTAIQRRSPTARDPRTREGELLHPARFTEGFIKEIELHLGGEAAAQLEQRPAPLAGALVLREHLKYANVGGSRRFPGEPCFRLRRSVHEVVEIPVKSCTFFQTADTAMKTGRRNDYTAVGTFAFTPHADLVVFHMFRAKIEVPYQYHTLQKLRRGPGFWSQERRAFTPSAAWVKHPVFMAVEPKASGIGLLQQAIADGRPFRELKVDGTEGGDKISRFGPIAAMYAAGKVYHLEGQSWLAAYEDELLKFPQGAHDDQCFAAGTEVKTRRGDVPIEAVRVGDDAWTRGGWRPVVWAGETTTVLWAGEDRDPPVVRLELDGWPAVTATPNHRVWVEGHGWREIRDLRAGDLVHVLEGDEVGTRPVAAVRPAGSAPVYNLTVEDWHEYVGGGILSHNCDCVAYAGYLAGREKILRVNLQTNFSPEDFKREKRQALDLKSFEAIHRRTYQFMTSSGEEVEITFPDDD
jgi:predicted phage terminase large subunit-like protein